jgi:hypothetical protein
MLSASNTVLRGSVTFNRIGHLVALIQRHCAGVILRDHRPGHLPVTAEPSMGDLVNLRAARKRAKRRQAEQKAASNRLVHGRSKAEQALAQSQSDKARKELEQHRIDTGDGQ